MSLLSEKQIAFLRSHQVGRLATTDGDGPPHIVPTNYKLDTESGTIKIGHFLLESSGQQRLYLRHLATNPQAAFVVDDWVTESQWTPNGVTIKGPATLHTEGGETLNPAFGPRWLEITPMWVSSWGIDTHPYQPAAPWTS